MLRKRDARAIVRRSTRLMRRRFTGRPFVEFIDVLPAGTAFRRAHLPSRVATSLSKLLTAASSDSRNTAVPWINPSSPVLVESRTDPLVTRSQPIHISTDAFARQARNRQTARPLAFPKGPAVVVLAHDRMDHCLQPLRRPPADTQECRQACGGAIGDSG